MGNVQASAKPVTSSIIPPPSSSPEINPESSLSQSELDNKTNYVKLENPGTMEELHKKCKGFYSKIK